MMVKERNPEKKEETKKKQYYTYEGKGVFFYFGSRPEPYKVDVINNTCECESFKYAAEGSKMSCKHLVEMRIVYNAKYRESESVDNDGELLTKEAIKKMFKSIIDGYNQVRANKLWNHIIKR